ncbi:MAG: GNAT family N-acetyltransferase [Paracoccus sp. (in: a-proteobacteria)]|uniref:GNAT family N-acetyltransferase n=1 Tax=Paracoccus sp. TaxID=267 RepID=UPI0039E2C46F
MIPIRQPPCSGKPLYARFSWVTLRSCNVFLPKPERDTGLFLILAHVADTPPVALERFESGSGWVAESEGGILGYALSKPVDNLLFLDNISTQPEAKGMGIGKKLLERFLVGAAKDGFDTVALTTFRSPPWNGPWFRQFEFLPIPEVAIGPQLAAIIERQGTYLDPKQREALSRRVSAIGA